MAQLKLEKFRDAGLIRGRFGLLMRTDCNLHAFQPTVSAMHKLFILCFVFGLITGSQNKKTHPFQACIHQYIVNLYCYQRNTAHCNQRACIKLSKKNK